MKKISCPKCGSEWDKDEYIGFHIKRGMPFTITFVKIQDLIFCPNCFFTPKGDGFDYPESYEAKLDKIILQESGLKIKSIVVEDEFGRYLDMDIEDFRKLKVSGFNPHPDHNDDGGETMATSGWGGSGPDCISVPGGAWLGTHNKKRQVWKPPLCGNQGRQPWPRETLKRIEMTRKIDIISNCLECSWCIPNKSLCGKTQKQIILHGEQGFPDWCPLKDDNPGPARL